jgi:hypothetical protein
MFEMRNPGHHDLERNRNLLFDLFGCAAGPVRDYLDVVVSDVWIGFDREVVKGDRAPNQQQKGGRGDEKTIVEGEIDEGGNHA